MPDQDEDGRDHRRQHEQSLQGIGPDDSFYTASEGIEPDKQDRDQNCDLKGDTPLGKYEMMYHRGDEEKTKRSDQKPGNQEEKSPSLMAFGSEAMLEIFVDRSDVHFEIEGDENPGDQKISQQVSHHDLHVTELGRTHPARNRDESHPRQRGPDHSKCYHIPGRISPRPEKNGIAVIARSEKSNEAKQQKVDKDDGQKQGWRHDQ